MLAPCRIYFGEQTFPRLEFHRRFLRLVGRLSFSSIFLAILVNPLRPSVSYLNLPIFISTSPTVVSTLSSASSFSPALISTCHLYTGQFSVKHIKSSRRSRMLTYNINFFIECVTRNVHTELVYNTIFFLLLHLL